MIKTYDVLAEFVLDLGSDFAIDAVNEHGVAFYYRARHDLKFSMVTAPMFGTEEGHVSFICTKNAYPTSDSTFKIEDPDLLENIKSRIAYWLEQA